MKRIYLIAIFSLIAFVSFGQSGYPVTQNLGAPGTNVRSKGGLATDSSYTQGGYADTSSANLGFIKNIPFTQIRVGTNYYMRNSSSTRWVLITGGGGAICAGLQSGGNVTWTNTGLAFSVTEALYCINGNSYHSPTSNITLNAADPSLPRLDVIALDTFNHVIKITGTPSANPSVPTVNPLSQLYLTAILVPAGATTPGGITTTVIYDENVEWATSSNLATGSVDFNSTSNPFHLTKNAVLNPTASGTLSFQKTSLSLNLSSFSNLTVYIKLDASTPTAVDIGVDILNNGSVTSTSTLAFRDYGFNPAITSYQTVVIPISDFPTITSTFNGIRLRTLGDAFGITGSNLHLDYIQLQSGVPSGGSSPYITNVRRRAGTDTVEVEKNGVWMYSFKDSIGSGGGGVNIYNSDGTITDEQRTVDANGNSVAFVNNNSFYANATGEVLFDGTTNDISSQMGITSGYSVTIGTYDLYDVPRHSAFEVYRDSIGMSPYKGNFAIDSLNSSVSSKDKMMVWDSISGVVRVRSLPTVGNDSLDIPLQGTYAGKPVYGDIEMNNAGGRQIYANQRNDDDESTGAFYNLYVAKNVAGIGLQSTLTPLSKFFGIGNTDSTFRISDVNNDGSPGVGLSGAQDFSANITNLDYPQLIKVKQVVSDSVVKLTAGTNVTITGSGTSGSPYNISAMGGSPGSSNLVIQQQQFNTASPSTIPSLTTSTFTFGTGGLTVTGGNSAFTNLVSLPKYTLLENYQIALGKFVSTVNGTGIGLGIDDPYSEHTICRANTSDGKIYISRDKSTFAYSSATGLSFNSTDSLGIVLNVSYLTVDAYFINYTERTQVSVSYSIYNSALFGAGGNVNRTGRPSIWSFGGTQVFGSNGGVYYTTPEKQHNKLLIAGNSIEYGYAAGTQQDRWASLKAQQRFGTTVWALASATTSDMVKCLDELNTLAPEFVAFTVGVNDTLTAVSNSVTFANYDSIHKFCAINGIKDIWQSVFPLDGAYASYNPAIIRYNTYIQTLKGITKYINTYSNVSFTTVDGVHPDSATHSLIANYFISQTKDRMTYSKADSVGSGGGGSAAGSTTQIQYNNSGSFGASADFTWDNSAKILEINGKAENNNFFRVKEGTPSAFGSGAGIEMYYTGGEGQLNTYNRSGSAYTPFTIASSQLNFNAPTRSIGAFVAGSSLTVNGSGGLGGGGIEMSYDGTSGTINCYNRPGAAFKPLDIQTLYTNFAVGNVGIATASSSEKLEVTGNVKVNGNITASGTITPSDRRFKKNISPLDNALVRLMQLKPKIYVYDTAQWQSKHFNSGEQFGFIAQDLEKVLPQVIVTDKEGYKGVNYLEIIPLLVKCVQDQQKEIAQLKSEIRKLKKTRK